MQQAPDFAACDSNRVKKAMDVFRLVGGHHGEVWFAVKGVMVIMTSISMPMGDSLALVLEKYFFIWYWLIKYFPEL